jgi:plastocyanin
MTVRRGCAWFLCAMLAQAVSCAQDRTPRESLAGLRFQVVSSLSGKHHAVPAVAWLEALHGTPALPFVPQRHYTLLQKNRAFHPHLLVIPAGSVVEFPNADPFFHNVFSLYEGKRFDLGLYEAGSTKSVTFSRKGVSYIFCNIHPEMSAVVLTLSTPLYAIADSSDTFALNGIPPGDYRLHIWIEGVPPSFLAGLDRTLRFGSKMVDLGTISAPIARSRTITHTNEFGHSYSTRQGTVY